MFGVSTFGSEKVNSIFIMVVCYSKKAGHDGTLQERLSEMHKDASLLNLGINTNFNVRILPNKLVYILST